MEINVLIDEGLEGCLEVDWLQSLAEQVLAVQEAGSETEMGLVIANQNRVRQLNWSYLGKDEPTDVLAFSMLPAQQIPGINFPLPPDGVQHLGEVIISYPQAVIQAKEHQHSIKKEVAILIIHGILHILGYDHKTPELERQMSAKEAEILSNMEKALP